MPFPLVLCVKGTKEASNTTFDLMTKLIRGVKEVTLPLHPAKI